jgi:dihydroorotase
VTANDLLIKNARIIDPASGTDKIGDILIEDGIIKQLGVDIAAPALQIIDASGLIACPGFIDLHCHLRQPGNENKETIASGAAAASRGGFTTICCMPNTIPPLDNAALINYVLNIAATEASNVTILPIGCVTKKRAGEELTEMAEMAEAGCIGFSDDGASVSNARLASLAMQNAASLGLPLIEHCEDPVLANSGHVNDGWVASRLGLTGIPAAAEESIVSRDISLAEMTGAKLHLTHISTRGSVELIRNAKMKGLNVTADATPHHLTLTEDRVISGIMGTNVSLAYDTNAKVNPPLRTRDDINALIAGINDGTIDAIATDHAPHADEDKLCEFELAAFGISGFETAFAVLMTLVNSQRLNLNTLIALLTLHPARIISFKSGVSGAISVSGWADITLLDMNREWIVNKEAMFSKGRNTPYAGQTLKGQVVTTIHRGAIAYKDDSIRISK